ncbi:MAG: PorT family protein, partial [Muribaculaceae bacterium]|nr:PorT family protein [Muribaculaceae bacterium]
MLAIIAAVIMYVSVASAQLMIDTSDAKKAFGFGVRFGLTTSNLSSNQADLTPILHSTDVDWRTGFTCGVTMDIMLRNFFSLQPGLFFESRNCSFQHIEDGENGYFNIQKGDQSSSYFKIPIIASFRFLLDKQVEWQIDFGPYFSFGLGGSEHYHYINPAHPNYGYEFKRDYFGDKGFVRDYDWGFKMGTGLCVMDRYYVGVHYEAGCRNVLRSNAYNQMTELY